MSEEIKRIFAMDPEVVKRAMFSDLTGCEREIGAPTLRPLIAKIVALIQQGFSSLPAILAELSKLGIVLPGWMNIVIELLLAITPVAAT